MSDDAELEAQIRVRIKAGWPSDNRVYADRAALLRLLDEARAERVSANELFQFQIGNKRDECEALRAERDDARAELAALRETERQWDMHGLVDTVKANEVLRAEVAKLRDYFSHDENSEAWREWQMNLRQAQVERQREHDLRVTIANELEDTAARLAKADAEIERLSAALIKVERTSHATGNEFWGALYQCGSIARLALTPPPSETP